MSLIRVSFFDEPKSDLLESCGQVRELSGIVRSVKIKDYYVSFTVSIGKENVLVKVSGIDTEDRIKVYSLVGREVHFSGKISKPDGRRNPLCFDYARYLKGRGIYTICSTNRYKIRGERIAHPLLNFLSVRKAEFYDAISPHVSEESFSLIAGVMFGETNYMDEDFYGRFKASGIAHILAVSGLHVNLAYHAVSKLFKNKRKKLSDLFSLVFIFFYAALANFSISVLRAGLMLVLKIVSFNLGRRYDSVSAASLAAIIFLLANPFMIFDSGLQLSFAAAYSMGIALPWVETKIGKTADKYKSERFFKTANFFAPSITAIAGTAPLACYNYLMFSPVSLLLNPVIIGFAGIMLPVCLAVFCAFLILPKAILPFFMFLGANALDALCECMQTITKVGNILSFGSECIAPPLGLLILYYIFFFFFFSETRFVLHRKNKYTSLALIESFLLIGGSIGPYLLKYTNSPIPWDYGTASVTFLDVGQGDCIHVNTGKYNILIDGGGNYLSDIAQSTLKPYLLKNGVNHIDLAIITHKDQDHSKGIYQLEKCFDVRKIITNHDIYTTSDLDENDCCIVLKLKAKDLDILLMSDADMKRENALLAAHPEIRCDVLKVGHHGSTYSTGESFLKHINPSFAVISVGKNNSYGHPAPRVIELLDNSGIIYSRTDQCGAICLRRVTKDCFVFENAAKDRRWLIQRQHRENTRSEQ